MSTIEKGRSAEERARAYLEGKGYRFMDANARSRGGEVDLIMAQGDAVVFIEVKSRERSDFGLPQEAVTARKQKRVVSAALQYLKARGLAGRPLRFDVLSISPSGIDHIENAFGAPDGRYTL